MIQKLLVVVAAAALVSFACFAALAAMGGFPPGFPPGFGPNGWGKGGHGGSWNAASPPGARDLPYTGGYRLIVGYPAEITVTQGAQPRFTVSGPKDLIDRLTLEDGMLRGPDGPSWNWGHGPYPQTTLKIEIVTPDTHEFHLSGVQKLTLRNFDQDRLSLYISGSADVNGQGKARRLDTHISGSGHLGLTQLPVDAADISISGSGDADLDARVSSDVRISGSGHLRFACRPAHTGLQRSGYADVSYGPDCATATTPPAAPVEPAPPPAPAAKTKV